jgi:prepilin-type N-terminal cleavage/methylation domain-containing protein/prepilin-type processing-associated H-X9-DG protein
MNHRPQHHTSYAPRRAFSLVELLVVIGIIALLLSFLMPALANVRQRGRQLQCQATLKNIGLAAQMHVNDHQGYLPLVGWQFSPAGGVLNPAGMQDTEEKRYLYYVDEGEKRPVPVTGSLAIKMGVSVRRDSRESLEEDLNDESVRRLFRCPDQEPQGHASSLASNRGSWGAPLEWSSYIFSEALCGRRNQPYDFPQGLLSRVKRPTSVMFAMDGNPRKFLAVFDMTQQYTMWDFHELVLREPGQGPDTIDYLRHQYRANVLFCDWHVESVPLTEGGLRTVGLSMGIYD